jgi:hypothetical protein
LEQFNDEQKRIVVETLVRMFLKATANAEAEP